MSACRRHILIDQLLGGVPGSFDQVDISFEIGEAQQASTLALAQVFPRTAQFQVQARNLEAVCRFKYRFEPLASGVGKLAIEQDADAVACTAADAAPQLVQLRQTKMLCAFNHHQRSIGYVNANFDDGRADEQVDLPFQE